jgi:FkbM family methyltransferase
MSNTGAYLLGKLAAKLVSKNNIAHFLKTFERKKKISNLIIAYNNMGILKFDENNSGEDFFVNELLPTYLVGKKNPVLMDVGANIGNYSVSLAKKFGNAKIVAFEPTKIAYDALVKNCASTNVRTVQKGLGAKNELLTIYTSKDSSHNTMYKEVLQEFLVKDKIEEETITIETLDTYCEQNNIDIVDFLKIDVEGNELFVLQGATKMLATKQIKVIQFEFNEMNVVSRVFLKDFYDLLGKDYDFHRLDTDRLIPLGAYTSTNEIFQFQNIIAILK